MRRVLAVLVSVLIAVWPLLLPQPVSANPCETNIGYVDLSTKAGHYVQVKDNNEQENYQDAYGGEGQGGYASADDANSSTSGGSVSNTADLTADASGDNKANAYANGGYGGNSGDANGGYAGDSKAYGGYGGDSKAYGGYGGDSYNTAKANDDFNATGAKGNTAGVGAGYDSLGVPIALGIGLIKDNEGENKNHTNDDATAWSKGGSADAWSDRGGSADAWSDKGGSTEARTGRGGDANGGMAYGGDADGSRTAENNLWQKGSADTKATTGVALAKGGKGGDGGYNKANFGDQSGFSVDAGTATATGSSLSVKPDCKNVISGSNVTGVMQVIGDVSESVLQNVNAKYGNAASGAINIGKFEIEDYAAKGMNINLNPNTNQNTNLINFGNMGNPGQ